MSQTMRQTIRLVESMGVVQSVWADVEASGTVTDEIAELESAWRGGVANFGDKRAASAIMALPEYGAYQGALIGALRRHIGFPMQVFRVMPGEAFSEFREAASSVIWATSLSERFARRFASFAGHREPLVLVRISVEHPEAIIMRGSADEQEIVINPFHAADWTDEPHFVVVERL